MNLFFDARYTRLDYHDGISRYSAELGSALTKHAAGITFLIYDDRQQQWFPKGSKFLKIHAPTSAKEPFTARILNRHKPDVVYSPMQTIGLSGRQFKAVLTSHDMIYYRHKTPPKSLPQAIRLGWRLYHATYLPQRLALDQADLVTTVSENTAREFAAAKLTKRPVLVIPNAPQQFNRDLVRHGRIVKNIVYMGSFMPYKNVETLIKGMRWLPGRNLHLLSRIAPARRAELEALIPKNAQVIFHNGVSDEAYEKLLANNAVLATASFDEGYGIPVAEAMAMGVPAVVSDIAVFHEVGANGAVYFDPSQPKAFADAVIQYDNKAFRDEHIARGQAHMRTFDWDTSARILLNAIESLV